MARAIRTVSGSLFRQNAEPLNPTLLDPLNSVKVLLIVFIEDRVRDVKCLEV